MTIDRFTEAARAEAERTFPPPSDRARPAIAERMTEKRIGFEAGAEWARAYLAAQETQP